MLNCTINYSNFPNPYEKVCTQVFAMTQLWVGRTDLWEEEDKLMRTIRDLCNIQPKSVWFCRNKNTNQLEGYGFVDFETQQDAADVMRLLKDTPMPHSPQNKFKLNWGTANVGTAPSTAQTASGYSVYVGNLPISVNEAKLLSFFKRYIPQTISARLIYDSEKISRGFGFVKLNSYKDMKDAIQHLNGSTEFGDRPLKVSEAKDNRVVMNTDGSVGEQSTNILFIRDIDPDVVKAETIFHHFQPYGKVLDVRIIPDHPDWANVKMETVAAAEMAKKSLQGARFGGSTRCDIEFGKEFDENPTIQPKTVVTVPKIAIRKPKKKQLTSHFNEEVVGKVTDAIQAFAEFNRRTPIAFHNHYIANTVYSQKKKKQQMFDWATYTDVIPPTIDPFMK